MRMKLLKPTSPKTSPPKSSCQHTNWSKGPIGIRTEKLLFDSKTNGYYCIIDAVCRNCGTVFLKRIDEE